MRAIILLVFASAGLAVLASATDEASAIKALIFCVLLAGFGLLIVGINRKSSG